MADYSYDAYSICNSNGWNGSHIPSDVGIAYIRSNSGYIQFQVSLKNYGTKEHISSAELAVQFCGTTLATETVTAVALISDDPFTGTSYSTVMSNAKGTSSQSVTVHTYPTNDVIFTFNFENSSELKAINKTTTLYFLVATSSTTTNIVTSSCPESTYNLETPGIDLTFGIDVTTYTVSYNANGGSTTPSSQSKPENESITLASSITRAADGPYTLTPNATANGGSMNDPSERGTAYKLYDFYCWKASDSRLYSAGEEYSANEDTTMTAQWTPRGYTDLSNVEDAFKLIDETYNTSRFYRNDGTNQYTELSSYRNKSYAFNGWYTMATGGDQVTSSTMFSSDASIYAQYGSTGSWVGDSTPIIVPTITRDGYELLGYSSSSTATSASYTPGELIRPDTNLILYAVWKIVVSTIEITFNTHGGTIQSGFDNPHTYTVGGTFGTLPTCTRSGYRFDGWYTASSGGIQITSNTSIDGNVTTVHAHWNRIVSVTFYPNGGSISTTGFSNPHDYVSDGYYSPLPDCIRSGYTFQGWYTSSDVRITESTSVLDNIVTSLYSKWELNPVEQLEVNFYVDGSVYTTNYYDLSGTYNPLPSSPTKTGYTFKGWYTASSGGTKVTTSTSVTTSISRIYAQFTAKTITVTFNPDGGTVSPTSKAVTYDSKFGDLPTPDKGIGYTFIGWFTSQSGGTEIKSDTIVKYDTNITLYARYNSQSITIRVTFNPGEGSVSPTSKSVTYGGIYGTLPTPTRDGYTFTGWYTTPITGGDRIESTTTVTYTSDITLYARYNIKTITVTFNANGGSVSPSSKTVTYGETFGTLPTPTRSGYTFDGWYIDGNKITSTTIVTYTSNITLTANWINTYTFTLTFDINGGTGTVPSTITDTSTSSSYTANWDTSSFSIATPGWKGWSTSPYGSVISGGTNLSSYKLTYNSSTDKDGIVNRTLYAIYETVVDTNSVRIYTGSRFVKATPYIYYNGRWNKATAYVYSNGWKKGN